MATENNNSESLLAKLRERHYAEQSNFKAAISNDDIIPKSVYDNLPALLKDSCNVFNDRYEKDVFLTGVLAVLGGCFHNLYAYNQADKKRVSTNLLSIIVGPPASGKGALNYVKKLAAKIAETFAENYKKLGSRNGNRLFIPANTAINQAVAAISPKNKKIDTAFLYLQLQGLYEHLRKISDARGGNQSNLNSQLIKELKITIPPIETQRQIVTQIEKEQALVNASKQLIEIFEQKIKDRIAKVWGADKKVSVVYEENDLVTMAAEPE